MSHILTISFILGILLLLLSMIFLMSKLRERFVNTPQRIEFGGLKLEVSILTLFVLISVGLIGINIWFQLQQINDQMKQVETAKNEAVKRADDLRRELEKVTRSETEAYVTLSGVNKVTNLDLKNLSCTYTTRSGDSGEARLELAAGNEKFKVTFKNLTKETIITSLEVVDQQGEGKVWSSKEEYQPLKPHTFELKL